jgi:hypothetical protein
MDQSCRQLYQPKMNTPKSAGEAAYLAVSHLAAIHLNRDEWKKLWEDAAQAAIAWHQANKPSCSSCAHNSIGGCREMNVVLPCGPDAKLWKPKP